MSEGGVAAGIRRVEAITGENALRYAQEQERRVQGMSALLKVQPDEVAERVAGILDNVRALEKELARLKGKLAASQGDELVSQAVEVGGIKVLAALLEGADVPTLRDTMDKLKDKLKSAAIVLASVGEGKVSLIAGVTADHTAKVKAGELVNFVAQQVGGKGGGRPDMAQAGGTQPENLPAALAGVKEWVAGSCKPARVAAACSCVRKSRQVSSARAPGGRAVPGVLCPHAGLLPGKAGQSHEAAVGAGLPAKEHRHGPISRACLLPRALLELARPFVLSLFQARQAASAVRGWLLH